MNTRNLTLLGVALTVAAAAFAPMAVHADDSSRQKNKNQWRNGAILGGAAALYGLHNHDTTTTILGAGAAAYSASRYEKDRHSQSQAQAARDNRARYHRSYRTRSRRYHHNYR